MQMKKTRIAQQPSFYCPVSIEALHQMLRVSFQKLVQTRSLEYQVQIRDSRTAMVLMLGNSESELAYLSDDFLS